MSEDVVCSDVKFTKNISDRGDAASAAVDNVTYSEVGKGKTDRNQKRSDNAGDPDSSSRTRSEAKSEVRKVACDPLRWAPGVLCALFLCAVIALVVRYFPQLETGNEVIKTLQDLQQLNRILNANLTWIMNLNDDLQLNLSKAKTALQNYQNQGRCEACPKGWDYNGGKCYYFSMDKLNWADSRDRCVSMGGHLAIISKKSEQQFLMENLINKMEEDEDKFWIGLTDMKNENQWIWVDETPLDPNNRFWSGSEPDDWKGYDEEYGEDCVKMGERSQQINGWFDTACKRSFKSICETQSSKKA